MEETDQAIYLKITLEQQQKTTKNQQMHTFIQ